MADVSLPEGFVGGAPPPPAASSAPALPPGFVAGAVSEKPSAIANAVTGLQAGVGNLLGAPQAIGELLSPPKNFHSAVPGAFELAARYLPSPSEINNALYTASGWLNRHIFGLPAPKPYTPQTPQGRLGQAALGAVVPSMVGGGGLPALAAREGAGLAGTIGGELFGQAHPGHPWERTAVSLATALLGGGATAGATGAGRAAIRPFAPGSVAPREVAGELATASGQSGRDLAASIGENLPKWTPGTRPTLGAVTGNAGIRNLEYADQAAAARAGNPIYQTGSRATNAAQRAAIAKVTPDAATTIRNLTADRDAAVNAIPAGLTAQQAGQQFRENLQGIYDQRAAARAAGGSAFDALENHPAHINLNPIMDYARLQASGTAGEVGQAYRRALDQFQSATGITLDTAPFANSVLKGLGDLAASYPRGSAAARAVLDVKNRLETSLADQVPEISAARAAWAEHSRPLDVFQTRPFAQVLATDRFGRGYVMPNDAVVDAFLRGKGSADSLDALNGVFGDPEASSRALQDYIAGQVQQRALRPDGAIDVQAMQRVLAPYQRALIRFPALAAKFKTAAGAQQAVEQATAYARLYDEFAHGLGTLEHDAEGNPMYSPAAFDRAVKQAGPLLGQAYGSDGAAVINRVNDELSSIAQTAYAKVKGQSGTPQAMPFAGRAPGHFGQLAGSVAGALLEHLAGGYGAAGAIVGAKLGEFGSSFFGHGNRAVVEAVDAMRRQALTDPDFARSLLTKYNPAKPTTAARRALNYALRRMPGLSTPLLTPPQVPGPRAVLPYPRAGQ